jgi:hypothetical protein
VFANILERDQKRIERLRIEIREHKIAIGMADGLIGMQQSQSYKQFVAAVDDNLRGYTQKLLLATGDREAAVLSGRCLGLQDVLQITLNAVPTRARLAAKLAALEDEMQQLQNPQPQPFLKEFQ